MRVIQGCAILLSCVVIAGCGGSNAGEKFEGETPEPKPEPTKPEPTKPDDKDTKKPKPFSLTTTSVNDLPKCETASQGALAYTTVDKAFHACADGKWTKIDAKGEKGDAGAPAPNDGNKIKFTISCSGPIQNTPYFFQYQAAEFLSGDVLVRANISDFGQDYSGSSFYSATQNGSLTAPVQIGFDGLGSANSGWWNLSLPRDTLILSIVNSDQDISNAEHKNTWTMPTSACTKTVAP